MVRGKIQMKKIENATNRQVTFSKRRTGLLKKSRELSVLCDAEVAVIIFSQKGRLYDFSSSDMQKTIERYHKFTKEVHTDKPDTGPGLYMQELMKHQIADMVKKIEVIEVSRRRLLGQDLGSSTIEELQQLDRQLNRSLRNIRARKAQLFQEQKQQLKAKERYLLEENARLSLQCGELARQPSTLQKDAVTNSSTQSRSPRSEVETELFIGLPDMRCTQQTNNYLP